MVDLLVIGLGAFAAVLGVWLLLQRIGQAASLRRSRLAPASPHHHAVAGAQQPAAARGMAAVPSSSAPDAMARLEMQLRDASQALFLMLMECCAVICENDDGTATPRSDALIYASELRQAGRSWMANREIADHAYQLAATLEAREEPAMKTVKRMLNQLAAAERLGSR
jgi:hypothetical protein